MDKVMMHLQDIKKIYHIGGENFAALNNVSLTIKEGDFIALMGPSGSGKSTLMNILGCLDRPTSGIYELDGEEVSRLSDDHLAMTRNRKIGFVFQNFNLLSRISALHNVALPLVYAGIGKKEREERAMALLTSVGLDSWAHHQPNELSGGQQQRVAIARALVNNPHIIMADEPTGNLDTKSTKEIMGIFETLHARHHTIILVTHEPEIASCADRQLLMCDGRITRDEGKGVSMDVV
jgi:putative ABC transport system ATP-binding protein